jgi:hypothetical protein
VLIDSAKADDAVARALLAKRNPVLEAARAEDRAAAKIEALLVVLAARGVALAETDLAHVRGERDSERLDRWIARAATCTAAAELFTAP